MSAWGEVLVGLAILVGIVGVVVPVLPGALLVAVAIGVWAVVEGGAAAWSVLALALVLLAGSQGLKYVLAHRHLSRAGVPRRSITIGALVGIVGFFVIPVIGLPVGFVGGIYAAERQRLSTHDEAWRSTWTAVKATGVALLAELTGCCLAAAAWLVAALTVG